MVYEDNVVGESIDVAMLKKEFLRLLKEDEEFRYAVAGLIGLDEILKKLDNYGEELKKLREDFLVFVKEQEKKWEENNKRWEEAYKRFEAVENELKKLREDFLVFIKEQEKRWEENFKRWEENNKRWEENEKRWEENRRLWEENFRRWEENNKRWEENNRRWEEANRRFSRIELELGSLSESVYSRYVFEDLREEIVSRGERIISRLRNADFDGVEVDLLIATDRFIYVVEVKTKPSIEDVNALLAKAEVVQQKLGKPVVPVLTGVLIGREVEVYASSKNIKIYRY